MRAVFRFPVLAVLLLSLFLALPGCSRKRDPTEPPPVSKFEEQLNSYVGGPADDLFVHLGVPNGEVSLSQGKRMYEWVKVSYGFNPLVNLRYRYQCEIRAIVTSDNLVESWTSSGTCR